MWRASKPKRNTTGWEFCFWNSQQMNSVLVLPAQQIQEMRTSQLVKFCWSVLEHFHLPSFPAPRQASDWAPSNGWYVFITRTAKMVRICVGKETHLEERFGETPPRAFLRIDSVGVPVYQIYCHELRKGKQLRSQNGTGNIYSKTRWMS